MTDQTQQDSDVAELAKRIDGIRFAMVTLPADDHSLRGRPLTVQTLEFDGTLWFLVSRTSDWTSGLGPLPVSANAAFSDGPAQRWVSIAGRASLVDDRERIHQMWSTLYQAWFDGPDDPDLVLLRFDSDVADYWDADAGRIVRLARLVRAAVTGDPGDLGDRGTLRP